MVLKQGDAVLTHMQEVSSALTPVGVFLGENRRNSHTGFSADCLRGQKRPSEETFRNCSYGEFT